MQYFKIPSKTIPIIAIIVNTFNVVQSTNLDKVISFTYKVTAKQADWMVIGLYAGDGAQNVGTLLGIGFNSTDAAFGGIFGMGGATNVQIHRGYANENGVKNTVQGVNSGAPNGLNVEHTISIYLGSDATTDPSFIKFNGQELIGQANTTLDLLRSDFSGAMTIFLGSTGTAGTVQSIEVSGLTYTSKTNDWQSSTGETITKTGLKNAVTFSDVNHNIYANLALGVENCFTLNCKEKSGGFVGMYIYDGAASTSVGSMTYPDGNWKFSSILGFGGGQFFKGFGSVEGVDAGNKGITVGAPASNNVEYTITIYIGTNITTDQSYIKVNGTKLVGENDSVMIITTADFASNNAVIAIGSAIAVSSLEVSNVVSSKLDVNYSVSGATASTSEQYAVSTITLPVESDITVPSGKIFVGWDLGGDELLKAGASVDLSQTVAITDTSVTFTAVFITFNTIDGASIKTSGLQGIRFRTAISNADITLLTSTYGKTVAYGTRLTCSSMDGYLDIPNEVWFTQNAYLDTTNLTLSDTDTGSLTSVSVYTGVLTGLDSTNYNYQFVAQG